MADDSPPAMRDKEANGSEREQGQGHQAAAATLPPDSAHRPGGRTSETAPSDQAGRWHVAIPRHSPYHRQAFAAIDLGTNNCRLLIARPDGEHFTVIDAFSRVVRLGEGLAQSGRLSQAAMDRALGALHVCADKLRRRNVHIARSVATEACRRAENGEEFITRVAGETGILLDIISAQEEARLAVMGCHLLLEEGEGPAMIFDIGGGSTELVLVESRHGQVPKIHDWQSVPWGVVSLTESCVAEPEDAVGRALRYDEMRRMVRTSLAPFVERIASAIERAAGTHQLRLLGTSGTVTTLASLHLELPQYDRRAVDGLIVSAQDMAGLCERLALMTPEQRRAQPCIGRERADLVVAGCAILQTIFELWPADRLGVADRGIREGILRSLMASSSAAELSRQAVRQARRNKA
ncbi:MAG: hypothetical protein RL299_1140 [Pseudomonadota bacterium]|jgi:exopolyphosphatase/guanosine-5'-triphosphate,3'-diphosphate pyrophosphatase